VNASEAERKEEEKSFKEVGDVFATLSGPERRACYDSTTVLCAVPSTGTADTKHTSLIKAHVSSGSLLNLLSAFNKSLHLPFRKVV
jgi:DnaJ-class molecular chaperone